MVLFVNIMGSLRRFSQVMVFIGFLMMSDMQRVNLEKVSLLRKVQLIIIGMFQIGQIMKCDIRVRFIRVIKRLKRELIKSLVRIILMQFIGVMRRCLNVLSFFLKIMDEVINEVVLKIIEIEMRFGVRWFMLLKWIMNVNVKMIGNIMFQFIEFGLRMYFLSFFFVIVRIFKEDIFCSCMFCFLEFLLLVL